MKFTGLKDIEIMDCDVDICVVSLKNRKGVVVDFELKELDMESLLQSPTGSALMGMLDGDKSNNDDKVKIGSDMLIDAFVDSVVDDKGEHLSKSGRKKLKIVFLRSFEFGERVKGGMEALRLMGFDKIGVTEKNSKKASSDA